MVFYFIGAILLAVIIIWVGKASLTKQDRAKDTILELLGDSPELPHLIQRYDALLEEARVIYRRVADDSPHDIVLFNMLKEAHNENINSQEW